MALPVPRSVSPSKVSSFTDCPLAFRFAVIDHRPEPPSPHAVKGTLVHRALERLFWRNAPGDRTPEVARLELAAAVAALDDDPEWAALALDPDQVRIFVADAETLLDNYFALEDPNQVQPVGVELGLEADVGGARLRGIIDRLDRREDGELVVVDYKTGRAPSERYERTKMAGVHTYAVLCELVLGRAPVEVRLLHLREPVSIVAIPTEQSLRGQRRRTLAVWEAIERACERENFRPRPGPLCRYCNFQALCPAFGGTVPVAS